MPPYPGAIVDQPDGVVQRLEVIMRIRGEDEKRLVENHGPPPRD